MTQQNALLLTTYTHEQVCAAFTKYVTNQRNCDKSAVQYFIGMIAGHTYPHALFGSYTRAEVLAKLLQLISNESNVYKCIKSDYTAEKVFQYIYK